MAEITAHAQADLQTVGRLNRIYRRWLDARCFLVGLKIAWVSVASAAIGFLLFFRAAPAQDILLEVKGDPLSDLAFWGTFYLIVILGWVLPVYISARWMLSHFVEGSSQYPNIEPIPGWVRSLVPAVLATMCLLAILAGQLMALQNAPTVGDDVRQEVQKNLQRDAQTCKTETNEICTGILRRSKTVQLGADLSEAAGGPNNVPYLIYAVAAVILLWLYIVPSVSRTFSPELAKKISISTAILFVGALALIYAKTYTLIWASIGENIHYALPLAVRLLPLLAVPLVLFLAWQGRARALWWVATICAVPAVVLFGLALYGIIQIELRSAFSLVHLYLLPCITAFAAVIAWWGLRAQSNRATRLGQGILWWIKARPSEAAATSKIVNPIFYTLLAVTVATIVALIAINPLTVTEYVHRALLLPIVFGLPVAVVTYLTYWSARSRMPLVLATIGLITALGVFTDWLWGDYNSVRAVASSGPRPTLQVAVERWAVANQCDLPSKDAASSTPCPAPIIVSAAGGASRAGFHVAGMIGALMDGQKFSPIRRHTGLVYSANFSKDGRRIVTASKDRTARIWDAATGTEIRVLKGHIGTVRSAAFNHDGSQIVTASQDRTARVWNALTAEEVVTLQLKGPAFSAAFNHDGTLVVTASGDKTAQIWDARTGESKAVLLGHEKLVHSAVFDKDAKRIVTASWDKSVRIWEVPALLDKEIVITESRRFSVEKGKPDDFNSAVFHPDGKYVVTASDDQTARIWDVSGKELVLFKGHKALVFSAAFSPDGKHVVTAAWDHTARIWEVPNLDEIGERMEVTQSVPLKGHTDDVNSAAYSPDGERIVTASDDRTARIWDARTGRRKAWPGGDEMRPFHQQLFAISAVSGGALGAAMTYAALADSQSKAAPMGGEPKAAGDSGLFPPCNEAGIRDPDWFASEIRESRIEPLDPRESWKDCLQLLVAGDFLSPVFVGLVSRDWLPVPPALRRDRAELLEEALETRYARLTATASSSKVAGTSTLARSMTEVRKGVYDVNPKGWLPILLFNGTSVEDGRRIITSDIDTLKRGDTVQDKGRVKGRVFRDAHDFHDLFSVQKSGGHKNAVFGVAIASDASRILTVSDDKTARIWDAKTGSEIGVFVGHSGRLYGGGFSPDGKRVVTASWDDTARVWDASTFREITQLKGHEDDVNSAAFSPDGKLVVTASDDKTARIWDAGTGAELAVLGGHTSLVYYAAFDSEGKRVVTASRDRTARVWDVSDLKKPRELLILSGHVLDVRSAAFNRNGNLIVTASDDKTSRVWNVENGNLVASLRGHTGLVFSAAFDPDGKRVVTGSWDNTVRLWEAETGRMERILGRHPDDVNTVAFSPDGKFVVSASDDKTARIWDVQSGIEKLVLGEFNTALLCDDCDVRLSTAVTMSARFPIISPTGSVLGRHKKTETIARVVDGGYHENFGATTAMELAKALKKDHGLDPIVILVNNEPAISGMDCVVQENALAYAKPPSNRWFSGILSPLEAFIGTRTARGSHAAVNLCLDLRDEKLNNENLKGVDRFAFVTVGVDPADPQKSLSASWWMSKRVQKYLDEQLTAKNIINSNAFNKINSARMDIKRP